MLLCHYCDLKQQQSRIETTSATEQQCQLLCLRLYSCKGSIREKLLMLWRETGIRFNAATRSRMLINQGRIGGAGFRHERVPRYTTHDRKNEEKWVQGKHCGISGLEKAQVEIITLTKAAFHVGEAAPLAWYCARCLT